jgi:hypothetical protein
MVATHVPNASMSLFSSFEPGSGARAAAA